MKIWYEIRVGDYDWSDSRTENEDESYKIAGEEAKKNPDKKVVIAVIREVDKFNKECIDEIVIQRGIEYAIKVNHIWIDFPVGDEKKAITMTREIAKEYPNEEIKVIAYKEQDGCKKEYIKEIIIQRRR